MKKVDRYNFFLIYEKLVKQVSIKETEIIYKKKQKIIIKMIRKNKT